MAVPKVFISSTCFDLSEIREQLRKFVLSFGFDPILSEHGDVFFHPDLHTHEACTHEVGNCQLFILIIGGRFGGTYQKSDSGKSITNAEYEAAKTLNIPIFTYINRSVLSNHHLYKANKDNNEVSATKIKYPAIENQKHAEDIFKFIDSVRGPSKNNAYEGFDKFSDIESHLRKQWAGLFFEFLKTREVKSQIEATNNLLSGLRFSNDKLEELIKSLYKAIPGANEEASSNISKIEIEAAIKSFYIDLFITNTSSNTIKSYDIDRIASIDPTGLRWNNYLVKTGYYKVDTAFNDKVGILSFIDDSFSIDTSKKSRYTDDREKAYTDGILESTPEQRKEILQHLFSSIK